MVIESTIVLLTASVPIFALTRMLGMGIGITLKQLLDPGSKRLFRLRKTIENKLNK